MMSVMSQKVWLLGPMTVCAMNEKATKAAGAYGLHTHYKSPLWCMLQQQQQDMNVPAIPSSLIDTSTRN
jgi:hypothetical protein